MIFKRVIAVRVFRDGFLLIDCMSMVPKGTEKPGRTRSLLCDSSQCTCVGKTLSNPIRGFYSKYRKNKQLNQLKILEEMRMFVGHLSTDML